jgi:hypothetical protein
MNMKLILTLALLGAIPLIGAGISLVRAGTQGSGNSLLMAQANSISDQNPALSDSVKEADYIFQGVVSKVEYRLSDGTQQLPYTFVTFKVEKTLKGAVNQQFITLRFIGGPDNNKKRFLTVSNVPLFDVGDRDILFVQGNGKSDSPLVGGNAGRFRIINNKVYTDEGVQLLVNNQGNLVYGSPASLQEVLSNKIGGTVVTTVFSNPNDGGDRGGSSSGIVAPQNSPVSGSVLSPIQLTQMIQKQVQRLASLGQLQTRSFVTSVDIQQKFSASSVTPVAPPPQIQTPSSAPARPMSDADRRELEMLRQNLGNPVFTNSKPKS